MQRKSSAERQRGRGGSWSHFEAGDAQTRNPKNAANETEKAALETFMAALVKKESPQPLVMTNADGSRALLAPIVLGNPLCLPCPGTPDQDNAAEVLQKLYPDDPATGFQLGDLRRLWRINFPASDSPSIRK